MHDSNVWSRFLLEVLSNGGLLNGLGGTFILIGAFLSDRFKQLVKSLCIKLLESMKPAEVPIPKPSHTPDKQYATNSENVQQELIELKLKLKCDRAVVLQFHNGSMFSRSNPMVKMSCTSESLGKGFASSTGILKDLLVSNYINLVHPFLNNGKSDTPGVTKVDACPTCALADRAICIVEFVCGRLPFGPLRFIMDELGMSLFYGALLQSPHGDPIGLIILQYKDDDNARELIQAHTCDICEAKHHIQALLYKPS